MSNKVSSFTSQLDKTLKDTFIIYRNRVIERLSTMEFRVGKYVYMSEEDARTAVDNSFDILAKSILKR